MPSNLFPDQHATIQNIRLYDTTKVIIITRSNNGCLDTAFVIIEPTDFSKEVIIPSGFSPNGDGKNDFFRPKLRVDRGFHITTFKVFDRYGKVVYNNENNLNGWDGRYKNEIVNSAVYFYFIEIQFEDGFTKSYKGDITVLK